MKNLAAPAILAENIMSNLYNLYWCAAFSSLNIKTANIEKLVEEGAEYARNKFVEIAEEFENELGIEWGWYEK
ncbi:MAG: hypothetical protein LIR50_21315 [Bacillota bacterium]|nr:hypothetical protein [Bacillota bacterium]